MHKKFDEILPYTYLIINKRTGMMYHGVRYGNLRYKRAPINDLGIHYFGSSSKLKIKKANSHLFEFKLKHTFGTIQEARLHESMVNRRLAYISNFVNICTYPHIGGAHSTETKKKISSGLQKYHERVKIDPVLGAKFKEAHDRASASCIGKKRTPEQKENYKRAIKNGFINGTRVIWNKGKTYKRK